MKTKANPTSYRIEQPLEGLTVTKEVWSLREELHFRPLVLSTLRDAISELSSEDCPALESSWAGLTSLDEKRAALLRETGEKFIALSIDCETSLADYQKLELSTLGAATAIYPTERELLKRALHIVSAPATTVAAVEKAIRTTNGGQRGTDYV